MFTDYPELISASVFGLIDMAVFIIGFQMVSTNFFTSIGMAKKAIFRALDAADAFPRVPGLIILPPLLGTFGVWLSIPIADAAAVVVTSVVFIRQIQKFKAIQ